MDWSKSQLQVAFKQLRNFMPEDEEVEYAVVARNSPNTIYVRPCLLATDRRIIYLEPKYMGLTSTPRAYDYSDFAEIYLDKGFFTHKISLTPYPGRGPAVVVDHLEKRRAEAFYNYVQGEIGALAPGSAAPVYPTHSSSTPTPSPRPREADPLVEKLSRLKKLRDDNLITEAEFAKMKADILDKL